MRDFASVHDAVAVSDVVFHAAAMKQVPTCEYFPTEAVATNVLGAENVVRAARRTERTHTVVAVSTDKACKPINVMGMTKALQERIIVAGQPAAAALPNAGSPLRERRLVARLGHPAVQAADRARRPGHDHAPRDDAVSCSRSTPPSTRSSPPTGNGQAGEIFVPQVPSARIPDVAAAMIGDRPIETVITGIRPGEKVHEILVSEEEAYRTTERAGHYVIQPALPELRTRIHAPALDGEYSSRRRGRHRRGPLRLWSRRPTSSMRRWAGWTELPRRLTACAREGHDRRGDASGADPAVPGVRTNRDKPESSTGSSTPDRITTRGSRTSSSRSSACPRPTRISASEPNGSASRSARSCSRSEDELLEFAPDALLILGDTNSGLSAIAAVRNGIPVFHMEAGNRCYDQRVPEERNRSLIDHISDWLLPYTPRSREYLLAEGYPARADHSLGQPDHGHRRSVPAVVGEI